MLVAKGLDNFPVLQHYVITTVPNYVVSLALVLKNYPKLYGMTFVLETIRN